MRGDIGPVEPGQDRFGGGGVVVGGAANQTEPGQVDHRINRDGAVFHEQPLDRRAPVEPTGKGGDDIEPLRLKRGDHPVIMRGIAGEHIRTQHQQPDRALCPATTRQIGHITRHALRQRGVIDADFGIFARQRGLHHATQGPPVAIGIAIDQHADHVGHIVVRRCQPILHGQEIGAHILRSTGDEFQQFGQTAQHRHLPRTGTGAGLVGTAQLLDHRHQPGGGLVHAIIAHPRQLDHVARRHQADHRIAVVLPRLQVRHHRADVIFEKQHRHQDDIAARDIGAGGFERFGFLIPVGGGVKPDRDARFAAEKQFLCPGNGTRQMVVQRDDHDPYGDG